MVILVGKNCTFLLAITGQMRWGWVAVRSGIVLQPWGSNITFGQLCRTESKKANCIKAYVFVKPTVSKCDETVDTIIESRWLSLSDVWKVLPQNLFYNFKGQKYNVFVIIIWSCRKDLQDVQQQSIFRNENKNVPGSLQIKVTARVSRGAIP